MLPEGWRTRFSEIVRQHVHETLGVVVADSGRCLKIAALEARVTGRSFKATTSAGLTAMDLPSSWCVGVILCGPDVVLGLRDWGAALPEDDLDRVIFYHPDKSDPDELLEPWLDVGLPYVTAPLDWDEDDKMCQGRFHKQFGRQHASQVVRDFGL